jgi:hypothetical protein
VAWRALLEQSPKGLLDKIETKIWNYEIRNPYRIATARITADSPEGVELTVRCVANASAIGETAAHAAAVAGWVALELGLSGKVQKPSGRVLKFLQAAITAGRIETCTLPDRRGNACDAYRLVDAEAAR